MKLISVLALVLGLLATSPLLLSTAYADGPAQHKARKHTSDPGVNARQHREKNRIKQGVRSGELTKDETKELRGDQKEIRQEERAYKSDGVLTSAERKDLHQDLNNESQKIYQEKHDAEKR